MKLINKTTGIVEFDGPAAQFPGLKSISMTKLMPSLNLSVPMRSKELA